jgi:hypothetical protein
MQKDPENKDDSSLESSENVLPDLPEKRPADARVKFKPVYLLILLGIILLLLIVGGIGYKLTKKSTKKTTTTTVTINTQSLDNGTLNKLTAQAGNPNVTQQLVITPDTVFKNSVQVTTSLTTNGNVDIGGNLNVKGSSTLQGSVGINGNLAVRGSLSVSGTLNAPALNVGTLGLTTLNASGSLNFGGHLVPSGAVPTTKPSVAAADGTVTISGNDTAGTVTISTGSGSLLAGEMAIISFHTAFNTTPKVQLTPVTATGAGLNYYTTRNPTFFTIDTATAPAANTIYVFDYLITQ